MRFVLTFLLMLATTTACAEWLRLGETGTAAYYLDAATVRKDGSLRRVWELIDWKARLPDGQRSWRSLFEYDCKKERYRLVALSIHSGPMATGGILVSTSISDNWDYLAPDTMVETKLRIVCSQ
jgi:hypothetical protein